MLSHWIYDKDDFIFFLLSFYLGLKKEGGENQRCIVYRGRRKIYLTASILSFYFYLVSFYLGLKKDRGGITLVDCLSRKAEDPFDS